MTLEPCLRTLCEGCKYILVQVILSHDQFVSLMGHKRHANLYYEVILEALVWDNRSNL